MKTTEPTAFFWKLAKKPLSEKNITEGTLMGFPCLRINGEFFATVEHRTGDLIVKLPAERVQDLIDAEIGRPFAPAGRVFREWALIPGRNTARWRKLMQEAQTFVASKKR